MSFEEALHWLETDSSVGHLLFLAPPQPAAPRDPFEPWPRFFRGRVKTVHDHWLGAGHGKFGDWLLAHDRPGVGWRDVHRGLIWEWLGQPPQIQQLLADARRNLGGHATTENTEAVVHDWFVLGLGGVIRTYDPAKSGARRFWVYHRFCYIRFCRGWAQAQGIPYVPIQQGGPGGDEGIREEIIIEIVAPGLGPVEHAVLEELGRQLEDCMNQLPEVQRQVLTLHYVEGLPWAEVGGKLSITEVNAKVISLRARRRLRRCLEEKGYQP